MNNMDKSHEWICIAVLENANTEVIQELEEFASTDGHKFMSFKEGGVIFGLLGVINVLYLSS